jgi:molybdopterin synthase catalytic subunit
MTADFFLTSAPLELTALLAGLHGPQTGAVVIFSGVVRDHNEGRTVTRLEYEAYEPMALTQLAALGGVLTREFGLTAVRIHHRLGEVPLGESALLAATAAPHRKAAIAAMDALVDRLKRDVPIWKKEYFAGGEIWVGPQE